MTNVNPRTIHCAILVFAWLLVAVGPARADSPASVVISETVDDVIAVLENGSLDSDARRARIEEIALERFDFVTMSKLVLARNWKRLTPEQQDEFVHEFKDLLARSYGDRIDRYDDQEVELVGERTEKRGDVTVKTRIRGGEFEGFKVDYRLRQRGEGWYIIDVRIEGVSLVSNYRDQFKEVLGRGGPTELLSQMRQKNAAPANHDES
jgi:phospholipid transport system substrate-binding protein